MTRRVSVKGRGAELFFGELVQEPAPELPPPPETPLLLPDTTPAADIGTTAPTPAQGDLEQPALERRPLRQRRAGSNAPHPESQAGASASADVVERIRKTVKTPGREVSFVRLTPEEKAHLADVVYTYKRQGVKTSENEINRIAVNYILNDYYEHGEESVLVKVIAALRA